MIHWSQTANQSDLSNQVTPVLIQNIESELQLFWATYFDGAEHMATAWTINT